MAVTCGFFNSQNGDRKYDARQFSNLISMLINDGVFAHYGKRFNVTPGSGNNKVIVGTGFAWFNNVWLKNDANYEITLPAPDELYRRIDVIVLEVNNTRAVRNAKLTYVKGEASVNPQVPSLDTLLGSIESYFTDENVYRYAIAYVSRPANNKTIVQSNITQRVGLGDTPMSSGILQVTPLENYWTLWNNQFQAEMIKWTGWMATSRADFQVWLEQIHSLWDKFFADRQTEFIIHMSNLYEEYHRWVLKLHDDFVEFWKDSAYHVRDLIADNQRQFTTWFNSLQTSLDGDAATNLANKYALLELTLDTLAREQTIYRGIKDSDEDAILDSDGQPIEGSIIFELKHLKK